MDGGSSEKLGGEFGATNLEDLEGWRTNSRIAIWSLVLFGSLILNATLLLAFLKRPGLRTISNRFVMNLTASNLVTCVLLTVVFILNNTTLSYTPSLCAISEGGSALVTTSSILTVLLIAVDQYFAVVDPLRYRSRVDKIKCGFLIAAVWIIAAIFASLAAFNPNPRSLWQSCAKVSDSITKFKSNSTIKLDFTFPFDNFTDDLDIKTEVTISEDDYSNDLEEELELMENTTALMRTSFLESYRELDPTLRNLTPNSTYGLVYSITFSIFIYLVPFLTVCWIYISIYSAARKNSERTRRNGSRPILSSGSFCEEFCLLKQETVDEVRKIPKISSLSSIDENSEPSQIVRSKSSDLVFSSSTRAEDPNQLSSVIFTVGSQDVDAASLKTADGDTKDASKVPISSLKAKFLAQGDQSCPTDEPELIDQRRKSSHDLMYENHMMLKRKLSCISDSCEESSDEEMLSFMSNKAIVGNLQDSFQEIGILDDDRIGDQSRKNINHDQMIVNHDDHMISNGILSDQILIQNSHFLRPDMPTNDLKCGNSKISLTSAITDSSSANLLAAPRTTPIVTITPPYKVPLHRISSVRSTSSYINSLKYRISNGSIFKYREETRAARISALVIVMGLICWTPYVIILLMGNLSIGSYLDPKRFDTFVLSFLVLSTYVSPLLFGYRSKRVKRELRKFFCFRKELSYKNNRSLMAKKVLKRRHSGNLSQFEMESKYNILNCIYGKTKWPKDKVQFVQVPETALSVDTCRSSFSSGASTQISSTSTDDC